MKNKWVIIGGVVVVWFLFFRGKSPKKGNDIKTEAAYTPEGVVTRTGVFVASGTEISFTNANLLAHKYVFGGVSEVEADNIKRIMTEAGYIINEGGKAIKMTG